MNVVQFCYWLQGYFEIARNPSLNKERLLIIKKHLIGIEGEKIEFTVWLEQLCHYIEKTHNQVIPIEEFSLIIQSSLASIFYHVVDDSYEGISREERHRVHEEGLP